jgi:alpha-galactosidase
MTNYEVIDINQDRRCKPAERMELDEAGKLLLYKKTLSNGRFAIALFNTSDSEQEVTFSLKQLNLKGSWNVRDT